MGSLLTTIRFLSKLLKPSSTANGAPVSLSISDYTVRADVYSPKDAPIGVVLCVHGMTPYGYRDERMKDMARAFVACGYVAVLPDYPEIKQGLIEVGSVERIVKTVQALIANTSLCPKGQLAVCTASFSGCLCIRAVGDLRINQQITSLAIFGGCYDVGHCFRDILTTPGRDPFAKLILLKNI